MKPIPVTQESFDAACSAMRSKTSPLIRVGDDGPEYGQTISQKKALLEGASPDETILWPWAGQWSTTVFALTVEQARALVADPRHTLPSHRLLFPENIT